VVICTDTSVTVVVGSPTVVLAEVVVVTVLVGAVLAGTVFALVRAPAHEHANEDGATSLQQSWTPLGIGIAVAEGLGTVYYIRSRIMATLRQRHVGDASLRPARTSGRGRKLARKPGEGAIDRR
jgi:hypothetical protein